MINYKIDGDLFVVEADNTVYTFLKPTYPRQYKALNVSNDSFQIIALGNNERLYYGKIADTTIEGVVYSDINDFILQMNKVVFAGASSAIPTPYITSTLPMIDPLGVFVIKNTYSDGTVTYTLQDGSPYLGDTTLLLPYTAPELAPILFSYTPPQLANGQSDIVDVPVIGAILGQGYITLTTNLTAFQNTSVNAFVIADDLVRIIIVNNTGGTINLPTLDFKYIK